MPPPSRCYEPRDLAATVDHGIDLPQGVAPERMPKADATGLAPEKSAQPDPPALSLVREGSLRVPLHNFPPHFYGEVSGRRPWVFKRVDRPKGVPNAFAFGLRPINERRSQTAKQTAKLDGK